MCEIGNLAGKTGNIRSLDLNQLKLGVLGSNLDQSNVYSFLADHIIKYY